MSPSSTKSSTPVTGIVRGVLQLAGGKGTLASDGVASSVLLLLSGIVTLAVGWLSSTMVNDAVPPASVVTNPLVGETLMPAVSLSVLVTLTSDAFKPLYSGSVLVAAAVTML